MYRKAQIAPPWAGWLDGLPSVATKPNSFRQITNWILDKGRIYSPFAFNQAGQLATTSPILRLRSFEDVNGGWHSIALSAVDIEALLPAFGGWTAIPTGGSPLLPFNPPAAVPWAVEIYQNTMFFSAGPQTLMQTIGDNSLSIVGDVPGGCLFLGKLASRLIMLNTFENQIQNPRRVRWCGINNPAEWNFILDPSAGALDIPEVEDQISGWAVSYNVGVIFRKFGITLMTPTGNPSIPFLIQSFSNGVKGVGVYTPYTLASWGPTSAFRGENDIYTFDGSQLNSIGASAKKSILVDIENATGQVSATMIGQIAPGIDYLTYWLLCPQAGGNTNIWIYHFDDQSWLKVQAPVQSSGNYISCMDTIYTA